MSPISQMTLKNYNTPNSLTNQYGEYHRIPQWMNNIIQDKQQKNPSAQLIEYNDLITIELELVEKLSEINTSYSNNWITITMYNEATPENTTLLEYRLPYNCDNNSLRMSYSPNNGRLKIYLEKIHIPYFNVSKDFNWSKIFSFMTVKNSGNNDPKAS